MLKDKKTCRCFMDHDVNRLPDIPLHIHPATYHKDPIQEDDDRSYKRYDDY